MEKTSLSVIVPVYNEEYLVTESLRRLMVLKESPDLVKVQVIVVHDCSTDGTGPVLQEFFDSLPVDDPLFDWQLLEHARNCGKGRAIQTALQAATCEIAIIHDADLEYHPKDILRMIPLFIGEGADAVYGSRFSGHEYRRVLMYRHELGNRFLTFLANMATNLNLSDMETCYKAVRTSLLKSIPLYSNDFRIEPELTIKLAKRDARIFEVPINYSGRTYGEGKKIGWRDGVKAIWAILRFWASNDIFTEDEYGSNLMARYSKAVKFNGWQTDVIRPFVGQNVLEIGSGIGNITKQLIPRRQYCATDINPLYLQRINNLKQDKPYLSSSFLDLNDVQDFVEKDRYFDTIICLNVVEHLDDDQKAMQNVVSLLEKNGKVILLVPRGPWLFGSLDRLLGHHRRYDEEMLKALADPVGLRISRLISFNRISTIPWLINGRLFGRKSFGFFQISVLNFLTPLFRKIDRFLPIPSLSYIAILEKK